MHYCINIENKLKIWNAKMRQLGKNKLQIKNKYHLMDITLCKHLDGEKWHNLKCIDRNYKFCPRIDTHSALSTDQLGLPVEWIKWEYTEISHFKTNDNNQTITNVNTVSTDSTGRKTMKVAKGKTLKTAKTARERHRRKQRERWLGTKLITQWMKHQKTQPEA